MVALSKFFPDSHVTPHGVKTNCYAHMLGLPPGDGGLMNREHKSQPGSRCKAPHTLAPLRFDNLDVAIKQLRRRVKCDNPQTVHLIAGPHDKTTLTRDVPNGYHMSIGIVGPDDFHFLRRELISTALNDKIIQMTNPCLIKRLQKARRAGHTYVWSHVAGWSAGMKFTDASGRLIHNPIPREDAANVRSSADADYAPSNHKYGDLHYTRFVGAWKIKSRSARVSSNGQKSVDMRAMTNKLTAMGVPKSAASIIMRNRARNGGIARKAAHKSNA